MTLDGFLAESKTLVDAALDRWMPRADAEPQRLHEAMRYAIFAGGKRLCFRHRQSFIPDLIRDPA